MLLKIIIKNLDIVFVGVFWGQREWLQREGTIGRRKNTDHNLYLGFPEAPTGPPKAVQEGALETPKGTTETQDDNLHKKDRKLEHDNF